MENIIVSIVIVCMDNLKNLYPCLDSIKKYTSVSYEVFVVAYLFSKENLDAVRKRYPWVILIESNEIRGFSENNNLALRQAKGKYCFVLNDDTYMDMPAIDYLHDTIKKQPNNVAIVSPVVISPDGKVQSCGRQPINWITFILKMFHLWNWDKGKYTNQKGIFKSYNIDGSAFLIKTEVFRRYGWFDESYFFCPEDIALSTLLNKEGYECHVNCDVNVIHRGGMSGKSISFVQVATRPAQCLGEIIFFAGNNYPKRIVLSLTSFGVYCLRYIYHTIKSHLQEIPNVDYILSKGDLNCIRESFSSKTPKEIFIKYYHALNR